MTARLAKRQLVSPDYLTRPEYVETYGPEVADLCASANFAPDPQQELALDLIFAIRPDGLSAAFSFAVICCRQNLKTGLFKQASLGWLYVTEQQLVVWSAHEMSTTSEAQLDLANLILDSPVLRKRLPATGNNGIYDANGEERIELATGQRIKFKARTRSGGRGLTGDKVVLDEAFALLPSHMGSLVPTLAARPDPQVIYGSSAGKLDSLVLRDVRDRGRAGTSARMAYLEWLAPKKECLTPRCEHPKHGAVGCALDDVELWRKANPTLTTGRITLDTIAGMRQELPPQEFARECLGWWDADDGAAGALDHARWLDLADPDAERGKAVVFGADVAEDRTAWIAVAWVREDGATQVQMADEGPIPAHRLVARCAELVEAWGGAVVPPRAFEDDLDTAGVPVVKMSGTEFPGACGDVEDAVKAGPLALRHGNQSALNDAIKAVRWRTVGTAGEKAWQLKGAPEIGPVVAATRAMWGLTQDVPSIYETRGLVQL